MQDNKIVTKHERTLWHSIWDLQWVLSQIFQGVCHWKNFENP